MERQRPEPNRNLLDSYYAIPLEDRKGVLSGLMLASRDAPTTYETHMARQRGASGAMALENQYGHVADMYAQLIDKNFHPGSEHNAPQTVNKRIVFYDMIGTLTAEQISEGVKAIFLRNTQDNPSTK